MINKISLMLIVFVVPFMLAAYSAQSQESSGNAAISGNWDLVSSNAGYGGAKFGFGLSLTTDGKAYLETGCNSVQADFETDGHGGIRFSNMVSAIGECGRIPESEFVGDLMSMTRYWLEGNRLTLRNDRGHELVFKRQN